jgi:hypothetical protein
MSPTALTYRVFSVAGCATGTMHQRRSRVVLVTTRHSPLLMRPRMLRMPQLYIQRFPLYPQCLPDGCSPIVHACPANNRRRPHKGARPSATIMLALVLVRRSHIQCRDSGRSAYFAVLLIIEVDISIDPLEHTAASLRYAALDEGVAHEVGYDETRGRFGGLQERYESLVILVVVDYNIVDERLLEHLPSSCRGIGSGRHELAVLVGPTAGGATCDRSQLPSRRIVQN